jgi:hypothetical protein
MRAGLVGVWHYVEWVEHWQPGQGHVCLGPAQYAGQHSWGADSGLRYHYRQAQRRDAGRATGPFAGDYAALQAIGSFVPGYSPSSRLYRDYYGTTLLWGPQRRLEAYGLLGAHIGAGCTTGCWASNATIGSCSPR